MRKTFLFYVSVIIASSSCFSQESKTQNYICLNNQQIKNLMFSDGYEIIIPKNWCGYLELHDILVYSPKSLLNLESNNFKNNLYVASHNNKTYKSKNIEEALKTHYVLLNDDSEYAPVIDSNIHELYGKYYILKYKSMQNGERIMNLDLLFNHNNQDYIIYYSVLEQNFNSNLNDVVQIMESFKIIEK